jgi:ATP-dependent Clp protease ATP-binding subunit ClpA
MTGYERFTDRARKAIQLANQEAQRLNHENIDSVHILLGLVKEGTGVACAVLRFLGADLPTLRAEIEKIVPPRSDTMLPGRLPQTPCARKCIADATEEARLLNHDYVGTEHLLLGLLHDAQDSAPQVLMKLGMNLNMIRNQTIAFLKDFPPDSAVTTLVPKSLAFLRVNQAQMLLDRLIEAFRGLMDDAGGCQNTEPARYLQELEDAQETLKGLRKWLTAKGD